MYQRRAFIVVALLVISCATPSPPVIKDGSYTDPQFGISFSLPASWTVMKQVPDWVKPLNRLYVNPKQVLISEDKQSCIIYTAGKLNVSAEDVNQYPDKVRDSVAISLRRSIEKHKSSMNLIAYDYEVYATHLQQGRLTALFKLEETAELKGTKITWTARGYLAPSVRRVKTISFIFVSQDLNSGSLKKDFQALTASAVLVP